MHDLRRQALESGKTVSRKAQSRQSPHSSKASSRVNSAVHSRNGSRAGSRAGSDSEEGGGDLSDETFRYVGTRLCAGGEKGDCPGNALGWLVAKRKSRC
jgi:hypothetical protein